MSSYVLCPLSTFMSVFNNSGLALTNGLIYTYEANTSTPTATYTDSTGGTPNSNPIQLTVGGNLPPGINIYQVSGTKIKVSFWTNAGTVLAPVQGTQIGPTFDNLVGIGDNTLVGNSIYGGLDSGSGANTYLLSPANYPSYVDGTLIAWLPAHTNTGASTLNVNSIGAFNVYNVAGGALVAGQLVANQVALTLYSGGVFYLLNPPVSLTGSFTATLTGMTATTTGTVNWVQSGSTITMYTEGNIEGTSNTTALTMTGVPAQIQPAHEQLVPCWGVANNGSGVFCQADVGTSGTITFGVPTAFGSAGMVANASGFTNSGSKGLFEYWSIRYSLI